MKDGEYILYGGRSAKIEACYSHITSFLSQLQENNLHYLFKEQKTKYLSYQILSIKPSSTYPKG